MTDRILYLASKNRGKLREFQLAGKERGITVEPAPGIFDLPSCAEDGETFEANARKKALYYAHHAAARVFADDSGICVDALGGAPGVHSARYSGPEASDEDNNAKLLRELALIPAASQILQSSAIPTPGQPVYSARYECVIALADCRGVQLVTEGRADGLVIEQARGSGGFGYDPYFFYPPSGMTFAEMSPEAKFLVSHRGIAFQKLLDALASRRS